MANLQSVLSRVQEVIGNLATEGKQDVAKALDAAKTLEAELQAEVTAGVSEIRTDAGAAVANGTPLNAANTNVVDPAVDAEKASAPGVAANPNPAPGETPEGSTVAPQPTDGGNTVPVGDASAPAGTDTTTPADASGVQTSSDLSA